MPASAPVGVANGVAPVNAAVNGTTPAASPVDATAETWLVEALAQPPFSISKQDVATKAFQAFAQDPNRQAIVTRLWEDAYLQGLASQGKITFDGTTIGKSG